MTDLLQVLPDFEARPFTHLLPSLDKTLITVNDLLTLDAQDVAKRAQLPAGELRKLVDAVVLALHQQLGLGGEAAAEDSFSTALGNPGDSWKCISTLDEKLDAALGGGIPPGYLVEVTGESGAGKTQLLLTLLLAVQLPAPLGLSKTAVYISTEAVLSTTRLAQLLSAHPALERLSPEERPSLAKVLAIQTPDLESQEHILRYQLPVAIKKHNVGLVILDSVAANYRAEFEKKGASNGAASMAKRGTQLVQLGALLRELARTEGIAVVVANQVADRFTKPPSPPNSNVVSRNTSTNSQCTRDNTPQPSNPAQSIPASQFDDSVLLSPDPLVLDHQQRWFTGWGDIAHEAPHYLKTPSLGLVWTNQLACRIALIKKPVFASRGPLIHVGNGDDQWNEQEETHISNWRRWVKIVFAPWTSPTEGRGLEFEITKQGIKAVVKEAKT
ncbi:P-loop containing nucleoside triphosphate hydrolase protein [Didymella exigua CBS 183.55]|uniref:P-loop containing nucleoside triphosphate hydrolase protein n=1 Tax=Didymella exigua CBS 183.55 TaxID=1150837 RepID=A0A6A5RDI7_9PLEO|nr:P-loop containing nucleoside triphosphate hydrolase protein [Didymella exigua CBS 183.55]KAF1923777.1 P-loop containing nucleoside triphosphate hydrolase protein [Didymella exigua CBS 183.55]